MAGTEFVWLLQQQKEATTLRASERTRGSQQGTGEAPPAAAGTPCQPPAPGSEPADESVAASVEEGCASTAAAAVLHALACSAAGVPAFMRRHGFAQHAAGEGLAAVCSEALLAVLLRPTRGQAASTGNPESTLVAPSCAEDVAPGAAPIAQPDNTAQPAQAAGPTGAAQLADSGGGGGASHPPEQPGQEPQPVGPGGDAAQLAAGEQREDEEEEDEEDVLLPPMPNAAPKEAAGSALAAAVQAAVAVHSVPHLVGCLLQLGAGADHVRKEDGVMPLAAGDVESAGILLDTGAQPDPPAWSAAAAAAAAAAPPAAQAGAGNIGAKRKRKDAAAAAAAAGSKTTAAGNGAGQPRKQAVTVQPTPLVLAVAAGSTQLVDRLLAAGADVNRQCILRMGGSSTPVALTPLIAAVNLGSTDMVSRLLAAGADLHQKCITVGGGNGVDWTSALSSAVLCGSREVLELLVAAGSCSGRNGGRQVGLDHPALRAVVLAAQRGRIEDINLLYMPLAKALQGGSAAMLGTLRRRTALHPLAAAAEQGQLAAVDRLLELGAPVNHDSSVAAGVMQYTPLMLAAGGGHLAVVERLLAGGADPLKSNSREEMAVALALKKGQLAVVRRLLQHTGELPPAAQQAAAAPTTPAAAAAATPAAAVAAPKLAAEATAAAAAVEAAKPAPVPAAPPGAAATPAAGAPRPQLANASKAWQLGFVTGVLPRMRPLSLAGLEQERQR